MRHFMYSAGVFPFILALGCGASGAKKAHDESAPVDASSTRANENASPRVVSGEQRRATVYRFGADSLEIMDEAVKRNDTYLTRTYAGTMSPGCLITTPQFQSEGATQIIAEFRIKRDFLGSLPHADALASQPVVNINFNLESIDGASKVKYADLGFAPLQKKAVPELLATGGDVGFYSAKDDEYQSYVVKIVADDAIRSGSISLCNAFYDVEFDLESIEVTLVE